MSNDIRFLRIMDEVERQGGAHLPGICKPERIEYPRHTKDIPDGEGSTFKQQFERVDSIAGTGCHKEQRFVVPDLVFEGEAFEPRTTTVCFTDDSMSYWPRFAAIHKESE